MLARFRSPMARFVDASLQHTHSGVQIYIMGLDPSEVPMLVIDELDRQYRHPGRQMGDFTTTSIDQWVQEYMKVEMKAA